MDAGPRSHGKAFGTNPGSCSTSSGARRTRAPDGRRHFVSEDSFRTTRRDSGEDRDEGKAPLPTRDAILRTIPPRRQRRRGEIGTPLLVVLAIGLLVLAVIVIPQPRIQLTAVRYETTPCDLSTTSFVATAVVTLTNSGGGAGDIFVRMYVDGERRATGHFFVPAQNSVEKRVSVTIAGCAPRRYSVDTCLPAGDAPASC